MAVQDCTNKSTLWHLYENKLIQKLILFIICFSMAIHMLIFNTMDNQTISMSHSTANTTRKNNIELQIISYFTFPAGRLQQKSLCNCIRINGQMDIKTKYLGNSYDIDQMNVTPKNKRKLKHTAKLFAMSDYLDYLNTKYTISQQKNSIILMFVDGYDVIFQRNYTFILNQFLDLYNTSMYKNKVIWSTDYQCWPSGPHCNYLASIAPNNTNTLFLNAGGWIGFLYDVNLLFNQFKETISMIGTVQQIRSHYTDDQGFYQKHFIKNNSKMALDYHSILWQIMNVPNISIFELRNDGWINPSTGHYSSILHFAGGQAKKSTGLFVDGILEKFSTNNKGVNVRINGSFNIEFIGKNNSFREIKYSKLCAKYRNWFY
eukprot:447604_1